MPPIQCLLKSDIPERLARAHPPLKRLYIRGPLPDLSKHKALAVVGARKHSEYGKKACEELIRGLKEYPVVIVSGLAIGIDSIAHQAALENGLLTIAVPGSGLKEDIIYPQSKVPLARKILSRHGCLLSEYPPDQIASPWTFPERNRIMAGLADAVLIIEAELKSGTLITARIALDYNKDVLAVPGSIFSKLSQGPHFLISQGAIPVSNSRDIVEALGLLWKEEQGDAGEDIMQKDLFEGCSPDEKALLALLPSMPSRDEIARALGKPPNEIAMLISLLEIKGMVKEELGIIRLHP